MSRKRLTTAAASIAAASLLTVTFLQPYAFSQRRSAASPRTRSFHATVHADLKETYLEDRHRGDQNDHSEQELTVKYDIDKDFTYDGQELLEFPGQKAKVGGSFHARVDTQTSVPNLHEHYQMDAAGPILEGNIDFVDGTREQRIDVSNSDGVLRNCKSEGNIIRETDDCGVVNLSYITFHEYDKGKVVSLDHSVYGHASTERPRDLSADEDYSSKDWYGAVVQGTEASGFTVTIEMKKSLAPPVTDDGYKVTREKNLNLTIKVSPSGKTAQLTPVFLSPPIIMSELMAMTEVSDRRLVRADRSDR